LLSKCTNCLCWSGHSCMDSARMCGLWWDRNIRWWLYLVPPTTAIDAVSHWTLYPAPIIDFFVSFYACFHHVWRCIFHFQCFANNIDIFSVSTGDMSDLGPFCCR
jgi:hypothetical protein